MEGKGTVVTKKDSSVETTQPIVAQNEISESNPNQSLCYVPLNEFNYLPWSRAVTLALGGKRKLNFIKDEEIPDVSSSEYEGWLYKDQLVMSWLLNSMEPKISEIFSYSESSYHLSNVVKDMYGNLNNAARVFQLKKASQGSNKVTFHLFNILAI
ncbi:hypothetical protein ACLB2K_003613 [Fragaria x ananassa]